MIEYLFLNFKRFLPLLLMVYGCYITGFGAFIKKCKSSPIRTWNTAQTMSHLYATGSEHATSTVLISMVFSLNGIMQHWLFATFRPFHKDAEFWVASDLKYWVLFFATALAFKTFEILLINGHEHECGSRFIISNTLFFVISIFFCSLLFAIVLAYVYCVFSGEQFWYCVQLAFKL